MLIPVLLLLLAKEPSDDPAVHFQQGHLPEAERALTSQLARMPSDARALMLMGVVLDAEKRYPQAEAFYRRAIEAAPGSPAVWNNFGNHCLAGGNKPQARKAFERVLQIDALHQNAHAQLALLDVEGHDGQRALLHLNAIDAKGSDDPAVQVLYGRALVLVSRFAEAEQVFAAQIDHFPGNTELLYNLATAALYAGHHDRATQLIELAYKQKPDDVDVLVGLATVYEQTGRSAEAFAPLMKARRLQPKRSEIPLLLARACSAAGYHADAAQAWGDYLKLHPENVSARREQAFSMVRAGNNKQGLPMLESVAANNPQDPFAQFELGVAYAVSDPAKAMQQLAKAIALKPDFADAHLVRGALLLQDGNTDDAVPDLEEAIRIEPRNARALDQLGRAYRTLGRNAEAEDVLRRAAELAPDDRPVAIHYALALRDNGKTEESQRYLGRFKELGGEQKRLPKGTILDFLSMTQEQQRGKRLEALRRALEESPTSVGIRLHLASALLENGDAPGAEKTLSELNGDDDAFAQAGSLLLSAGRYAAAKSLLARAGQRGQLNLALADFHLSGGQAGLLTLDAIPESARDGDYWLVRAQMLDARNDTVGASEALNRGLNAAPTRPDLYRQAALFLIKHERLADASALLDKATAKLPDAPELLLLQGIVYEIIGRGDQSLTLLRSVEQRWPEWDRPRLVRGIALAKRARYAEARREIELAIALGAETGQAYYYLADSIMNTNRDQLEQARAAIERAIELSPNDAYVRVLAGRIAVERGDTDAAIAHYQRAVQLMPGLSLSHSQLARLYLQKGLKEQAAAEAAKVRNLMAQGDTTAIAPPNLRSLFGIEQPGEAQAAGSVK